MPRGIPNVRETPFIEAEDDSYQTVEQQALEAAESITAEFMRQHPPPDGERVQQKRHLTYWKMCENPDCRIEGHRERRGYITTDIATGGPFGHEQVTRYAQAIHGTNLEVALGKPGGWPMNSISLNEAGLLWAEYDESYPWGPFTHLFMAEGGVYLMPIDQFCQLGFHRDPTLAKFRRREIEALTWYTCDMCPDGKAEYLKQNHLEQHRTAEHREHVSALANARETAKVIGDLLKGRDNPAIEARLNQLMEEFNALREQATEESLKD